MSKLEESLVIRNIDENESRSESEKEQIQSRKSLRKKKNTGKRKDSQIFELDDRSTLLNSFSKSAMISESNIEETAMNSSKSSNKKFLRLVHSRSSKLRSTKNEELKDNESFSKSVDVVVDVHQHYEDPRIKDKQNSVKVTEEDSKEFIETIEIADTFSRVNMITRKNLNDKPRSEKKSVERSIEEDLIEEFDRSPNRQSTDITERRSPEKPRRRKQWESFKAIEPISRPQKPLRRRWSKDTCVIQLPEGRDTTPSVLGENTFRSLKKPIPAPRSSIKRGPLFSFDNEAFVSTDEEVLRIETYHDKEKTRIEMRKANDPSGGDASSSSIPVTSLEGFAEESLTNIARSDTMARSNRKKEMQKTMEKCNRISSKRRRKQRKIHTRSEEDCTKDWTRSEDELLDREVTPKKHEKRNFRSSSPQYSSEESGSTLEKNEDIFVRSSKMSSRRSSSEEKSHSFEKLRTLNRTRKEGRGTNETTCDSAIEEDYKRKTKKKKKKKRIEDAIKYISITIHKADMLEIDYISKHPMVKVHIVEERSGEYLKRNDSKGRSSYLQPMITDKFNFRENKSIVPVWEEELIFEHDFKAITQGDNDRVIIFFEIVDLLSFTEASFNYDRFGKESCWYKIAWAFLRPVGSNGLMHINQKVRLQLYRPKRSLKKFGVNKCEVYTWWKSNKREKYPSSLFVTITSIEPPKLEPVIYQQLSLNDILSTGNESPQKLSARTLDSISLPKWTRLAAQSCKIPNEKYFETDISENGCFFLTFSNDGKYLACVFSEECDYPINVYEVESKRIHVRFSGHKTFVYSLSWTHDDRSLLSVSSDQTARIWDIQNKIIQHIQLLPHPSYVYCAKFYPGSSSVVATGCYDRVARIWAKTSKSRNYELSQELEAHEGFVNTLCFQKDGNLFTADSAGVIILWTVRKNRRVPARREWQVSRKIKMQEIEGVTINSIILHPLESRLLVHSRDSGLRMIDLATEVVLQRYEGLKNQRIQSTACISPCGSLLFCGGEDSSLNVWNLETGTNLAKYSLERNFRAVTCVDYHPYDHIMAFCSFGSPAPVRVIKFDKNSTGMNVGLKMISLNDTRFHGKDLSVNLPSAFLTTMVKSKSKSKSDSKRYDPSANEEINAFSSSLRYENAKSKLRQLNETEQNLRSKSTSRLYNIIEKIDRILLNSSRSSNDLESGRSFAFVQDRNKSKFSTRQDDKMRGAKLNVLEGISKCSGVEDRSSSYVESSPTIKSNVETIEMQTFHMKNEKQRNLQKGRSKSAKVTRSNQVFEDEVPKTLSDSAIVFDSLKTRAFRDESFNFTKENHVNASNFITKSRKIDDKCIYSDSVNVRKVDPSNSSSSLDSGDTYVVEKADFEKNNDRRSIKEKIADSDCSLFSNATFTVENEVSVFKLRRKKS